MNAQKHTPAPWEVRLNGFVFSTVTGSLVADVFPVKLTDSECIANARLIAAGPELLEALRFFVGAACPVSTDIDQRGHSWSEAYLDQALRAAHAAIAKATGSGA